VKLTEIPMQESMPPEAQEISVKKHEGKAIMVKGWTAPPDSRQLVKQQYLRQPPARTVQEIYSPELNGASSCCTPSQ
jgi:hypothetical protein